jgi:hypothetical protein
MAAFQVPASRVALEGRTLNGMAFSLFDGQRFGTMRGFSFADGSAANPSYHRKGPNVILSGQRVSAIILGATVSI